MRDPIRSKFQENVQTTLIPAGGSTIVGFTVDVPGTYALVDHAIFRAFHKGAVGQLEVTGMGNKGVFTGKQAERPYTGSVVAAAEPAADSTAMRAMNNSVILALDEDGRPVRRMNGLGDGSEIVAALGRR